jgi:hypothetical protein
MGAHASTGAPATAASATRVTAACSGRPGTHVPPCMLLVAFTIPLIASPLLVEMAPVYTCCRGFGGSCCQTVPGGLMSTVTSECQPLCVKHLLRVHGLPVY